jgi:uncharacterized protein YcaQ
MPELRPEKITLKRARRLALAAQLLDGRASLAAGKEGAAQVVEHLGYLQLDTLTVLERAHHHALWTRLADYDPALLDELVAVDRRLFEYWTHAASLLPLRDYRYYAVKKRAFPWDNWSRDADERSRPLQRQVLARIRREGPLLAADFGGSSERAGGAPSERDRYKMALWSLWWRGEVMVAARRNFRRVYDLTERVLPAGVEGREPSAAQVARFVVRRALASGGLRTAAEIASFLRLASREATEEALAAFVAEGEVVPVEIKGGAGTRYYALASSLAALPASPSRRLHLLSPFDTAAIDRDRLRALFDFDYQLECYVPPKRRKWGYFVLPVLWREEFVGRLDAKADRKAKTLLVHNIYLEPAFQPSEAFVGALAARLRALAAFNGCEEVEVKRTKPASLRPALRKSGR